MAPSRSPLPRAERLRLGYLYGGTVRYRSGESLGPRLLSDFELVLVLEGGGTYQPDRDRHRLDPGTVILARPGFRECYSWDREGGCRHAYFHFGIEALLQAWPDPGRWPVVWRHSDPAVTGLFRSVLEHSLRRGESASGEPSDLEVHLVELLIELLLDGATGLPRTENAERPEPVARAFKRMRQTLEEAPRRSVSLGDLAREAGVSPKHLCRVFRQSVGHPPMETLRLLRLQLAVALLVRSGLLVKEIAAHCGFADPLYFSRCFSATFGRSPRRVRDDLAIGIPPPPDPLPVDVTPRVHW